MKTSVKKSVLITGASSGIGHALAETLGKNGYKVFAGYRKNEAADKLNKFRNVIPVKLDVTNYEDIQNAVQIINDVTGNDGLYAIVNNAGTTYAAPFEYAEEKRAREVMDVNVMAPYKITQAFIPLMKQHNVKNEQKARVINVASWAAYMGQPFIPFYNASKSALMGLSESMYYDLGLLDIHTVFASPGVTKTPLLKRTTRDAEQSFQGLSEKGRKFYKPYFDHYKRVGENSVNSKFFPTPEDIAGKLYKIIETKKPGFKYNMAMDAKIVDNVLTKFVPFCLRAAMNRKIFNLKTNKKKLREFSFA